jgi:tetratricopeptide (TPR) repeat protein
MAPAILLPLTWVLRAKLKLSTRVLVATWIGFVVVALIVLMRSKGILGQAYEIDAAAMFGRDELLQGLPMLHLSSVLTQAGLFFKYCLLMLIPNPAWMSIDMREAFILLWRDWTNWIGLIAFVGYGIFALICLLRGGRIALLGLALIYPWLFFVTEFSTIRVQEIFVLYRSYLWLPGYMLLFPLILSALPDKKIMLAGAVAAILLVPMAWNRLWVFADNYRLWDDAVQLLHGEDRLGAQRIYFNRAYYAETDKEDRNGAIEDYKRSLKISTAFPPVKLALASAYANAGRNREALDEYTSAIASHPKDAEAYYGLAFLLKKLHDNAGATASMQKSCDLGKSMACAMLSLSK